MTILALFNFKNNTRDLTYEASFKNDYELALSSLMYSLFYFLHENTYQHVFNQTQSKLLLQIFFIILL